MVKENASHEGWNQATDIAQAKEFIDNKGRTFTILTWLRRQLSGDRKQRLSIARAGLNVLTFTSLTIPSSALDYKTDTTLRQIV